MRPADVVELEEGDPAQVAVQNALRKARAVLDRGEQATVLGVDTLVALEGRIYGKPVRRAPRAGDAAGAERRHAHGPQRRGAACGRRGAHGAGRAPRSPSARSRSG